MEKTQKYTLKDFFKNIGSALYQAFIADNDVLDAEYVELTGDLANNDRITALENSLLQESSNNSAKVRAAKETAKSNVVKQQPKSASQTRTRKPKSIDRDER